MNSKTAAIIPDSLQSQQSSTQQIKQKADTHTTTHPINQSISMCERASSVPTRRGIASLLPGLVKIQKRGNGDGTVGDLVNKDTLNNHVAMKAGEDEDDATAPESEGGSPPTARTSIPSLPCAPTRVASVLDQPVLEHHNQPNGRRVSLGGGLGMSGGTKSNTTTVMSDSLKRSLARDLFPSKAGSKKSLSGRTGMNSNKKSSLCVTGEEARSTNIFNSLPVNNVTAGQQERSMSTNDMTFDMKAVNIVPQRRESDDTLSTAPSSRSFHRSGENDEDDEEISLGTPLRDVFQSLAPPSTSPSPKVHRRASALKKEGAPRRKVPTRSVSADQLTGMSVSVRLPNSTKPLRKTRSISFSKSVQVRKIPSQTELLERDVQSEQQARNELFFQAEEYDTIKRKTGALVRAIQQGKTPGGVTYCTRGLEKYFRMEEVQMKRIAAWDSVFYEQDSQRLDGTFDGSKLSKVYSEWTYQSEEEAAERARGDEFAIESYTRKTRNEIKRTISVPATLPSHQ